MSPAARRVRPPMTLHQRREFWRRQLVSRARNGLLTARQRRFAYLMETGRFDLIEAEGLMREESSGARK